MELRAVARGVRVPLRSLRDLGRHRDPERGQRRPPPDDLLAGDDLHLQQGQWPSPTYFIGTCGIQKM